MAKILYSICGIGLGHATRAVEIISELQKDNELLICSYGKALNVLKRRCRNAAELKWFKLIFENGSYAKSKTFLYNIPLAPKIMAKNFLVLLKAIRKFQPDFVVSDFEVSALYLAEFLKIPNITISNMHIMKELDTLLPIKDSLVYYFTELPILEAFTTDKYYITYFFKPKKPKMKNAKFFYPIIRNEVRKLKPKIGDYFLVYLGLDDLPKFEKLFRIFKYENFIFYTNKKVKIKEKNVVVKKISDEFAKDLANSKGIICHGGYSLLSEAAIMKKPAFVVTDNSFFERYFNGLSYEHLGFGILSKKMDAEKFQEFLDSEKKFRKNLKKANIKDESKRLIKSLKREISRAEKRKKKSLHAKIVKALRDFKLIKPFLNR